MDWSLTRTLVMLLVATALLGGLGCRTATQRVAVQTAGQEPPTVSSQPSEPPSSSDVRLLSHLQETVPAPLAASPAAESGEFARPVQDVETLSDLEAQAVAVNPTLRRMQQEAAAEWAQVGYISKLPDPTISSMFYIPPMNFEPDRQVAEIQLMQMIPWIGRLRAEARQAHLEALAAETQYRAERLRVLGDIRATWFKLYVLGKQIQTTEADQAQLKSLIDAANARIRTGQAQAGDVLMAMLELSSFQEQLLTYRQQVAATAAELNRLVGRDAGIPVSPAERIDAELPDWSHELLREVAFGQQPELNAARLRTAATRWGVEVAALKRRPDLTFGVGWVAMDAPGAVMPEAGRDSVTVGLTASIPLWHRKYDAIAAEASREHYAAHASEDEIALRLDALLRDLWTQDLASQQKVELYERTILPQARQTFEADQKSLVNNSVTFDRV